MPSPSESDLVLQAARLLIEAASKRGLRLRALGGIGVRISCPRLADNGFGSRVFRNDIDLVGDAGQMLEVDDFILDSNFVAVGAPHHYPGGDFWEYEYRLKAIIVSLGIYYGQLRFNHLLPLPYFDSASPYTIPITQLLLSKLSIVELDEKDVLDIYSILAEHSIAERGLPDGLIDSRLLGRAWGRGISGWDRSKTCLTNLRFLATNLDSKARSLQLSDSVVENLHLRLITLLEILERSPKTLFWRMKDLIANSALFNQIRWYGIVKPAEQCEQDQKSRILGHPPPCKCGG